MRLKNLAFGLLVCVSAVACRSSFADTLTLKSTSNNVVGGVYVYPYNLSLNGSSTTSQMMCINYDDHVTVGETWQVTGQQLSTSSAAALQEDAWLFSQRGKGVYSDADIQFAVWDILDAGVGGNAGLDATAMALVKLSEQALSGLTDSFLSQYTVYTPVTTSQAKQTWTDGLPQSFIAATPASVTPEPSTLLLLGTGIFGGGLPLMRRRKVQEQAQTA